MSNFSVTEIQIIPVKPQNGLVGFASCVINNQLYVGNIAIHSTLDGNFRLVFPTKSLRHGKQLPCVYPINKPTEKALTQSIVKAYEDLFASHSDGREGFYAFRDIFQ